jgi:hypothetical protein
MDFAPEGRGVLRKNNCKSYRKGKGEHSIWEGLDGHRFSVDSKINSRHTADGIISPGPEVPPATK